MSGVNQLGPTNRNVKVSVIVAVYNQQEYIGRCLRSILHQTMPYRDYEVIVVDDGSSDQTSYALQLFCDPSDSPINVVTNTENIGLPASLNKALRLARGKYVVRVDSDDFVNTNFLNFLHHYLETNSAADAVACDYLLIDDEENEIGRCRSEENPIACGIMFRIQSLINIEFYDEKFRCNEERDLMIRFKKQHCLHHLAIPLYRYRRHSANMTNDKELITRYDNELVNKHGDEI